MKPIFEFAATVKFEDVKNQYEHLTLHFGPRKKHKHGFGCDCGLYQGANHLMKGEWTYREDVEGYESFIAFDVEEAKRIDKTARQNKQILHDD